MTDQVRVVDNPAGSRYEVYVDGELLAGFAQYEREGDRVLFFHTEVDPAFEGRGLGSRLAAGALDDVRERGLRVQSRCPFISRYLGQHHQYDDLRDDPR
jgi:predicted GNAT family acetyltransferase